MSTTFAHSSAAAAMLIQPNGAIVVAGRQGRRIGVARYLANGSLDPSFSADGTFTFKFNNSSSAAVDVGLLPDGDLLVGAEVVRSRRVLLGLVALAPDGTLDASFGENGRTTLPIGKDALVGAVAASDLGDRRRCEQWPHHEPYSMGAGRNAGPDLRLWWGYEDPLSAGEGSGTSRHRPRRIGGRRGRGDRLGPSTFLPSAALLRLSSAGDLDTSFSSDGIARGRGGINVGAGVAIQGDGNIVLAGGQCCGGGSEVTYAVERFASDGSPDTTFGGDGTVVTTTPETQYTSAGATDVAIQSDGKILTVGPLAYILRLRGGSLSRVLKNDDLPDGSLDPAFGDGGAVTIDFNADPEVTEFAAGVAIDAEGRIVAGGSVNATRFAVARFDSDGNPDGSFSGDGMVTTKIAPGREEASDLAIQADGRIVVVGDVRLQRFALVRYTDGGELDPSFGGDGTITTNLGRGGADARGIAIQGNGKIVAAGTAKGKFALARYNEDGTLDPSFSENGTVKTNFTHRGEGALDVALDPDGRLVAAGGRFVGPGFDLARYRRNGRLDPSFGDHGKVTTEFGPLGAVAWEVAIQGDGRIVAAGVEFVQKATRQDDRFALARYRG